MLCLCRDISHFAIPENMSPFPKRIRFSQCVFFLASWPVFKVCVRRSVHTFCVNVLPFGAGYGHVSCLNHGC